MVSDYTPQELGTWVANNLTGCKFVGVSSDGEVFLRFDNEDIGLQASQVQCFHKHFTDVPEVTTVLSPTIPQVTRMVNDLNKMLEKETTPKDPDILQIKGL